MRGRLRDNYQNGPHFDYTAARDLYREINDMMDELKLTYPEMVQLLSHYRNREVIDDEREGKPERKELVMFAVKEEVTCQNYKNSGALWRRFCILVSLALSITLIYFAVQYSKYRLVGDLSIVIGLSIMIPVLLFFIVYCIWYCNCCPWIKCEQRMNVKNLKRAINYIGKSPLFNIIESQTTIVRRKRKIHWAKFQGTQNSGKEFIQNMDIPDW
jgi:hypothetical protein